MGWQRITDNMDDLIAVLPPRIQERLKVQEDLLLEVVMDLGRQPAARYVSGEVVLSEEEITREDLNRVVSQIGDFNGDNRSGIARTLHRIAAMRNRRGEIVGITCRVGRSVYGTIDVLKDVISSGKSILLVGAPASGKTTMLREAARILAETRRVIVVDTSNEIGGDGDVPHPAIGKARRMQVSRPEFQHEVMIEAVENHNPEVIIIDEIGRELEVDAARTIAERGVQLIGTAHGRTLENLIDNPVLVDLIGGIDSVTLSDEVAKQRGTQKSVRERKAAPTFDVLVEIVDREHLMIHHDVGSAVDNLLLGKLLNVERRTHGMKVEAGEPAYHSEVSQRGVDNGAVRVFVYKMPCERVEEMAEALGLNIEVVKALVFADAVMTPQYAYKNRRNDDPIGHAEKNTIPIHVLRSTADEQIAEALRTISNEGLIWQ